MKYWIVCHQGEDRIHESWTKQVTQFSKQFHKPGPAAVRRSLASPQGRKKAENKANANGQKSLNILTKTSKQKSQLFWKADTRANYFETKEPTTKRADFGEKLVRGSENEIRNGRFDLRNDRFGFQNGRFGFRNGRFRVRNDRFVRSLRLVLSS